MFDGIHPDNDLCQLWIKKLVVSLVCKLFSLNVIFIQISVYIHCRECQFGTEKHVCFCSLIVTTELMTLSLMYQTS